MSRSIEHWLFFYHCDSIVKLLQLYEMAKTHCSVLPQTLHQGTCFCGRLDPPYLRDAWRYCREIMLAVLGKCGRSHMQFSGCQDAQQCYSQALNQGTYFGGSLDPPYLGDAWRYCRKITLAVLGECGRSHMQFGGCKDVMQCNSPKPAPRDI